MCSYPNHPSNPTNQTNRTNPTNPTNVTNVTNLTCQASPLAVRLFCKDCGAFVGMDYQVHLFNIAIHGHVVKILRMMMVLTMQEGDDVDQEDEDDDVDDAGGAHSVGFAWLPPHPARELDNN